MSRKLEELRSVVRATLESMITEAVTLSPGQSAATTALAKVNAAASGKATVLFSRMLSRRIAPQEANQMADEIRSMAAKDPNALKLFNKEFADLEEGPASSERIGDMISSTLQSAPSATKPQNTLSFKSIARQES